MSTAILTLEPGSITFSIAGRGNPERRSVTSKDQDRARQWIDAYGALCKDKTREAQHPRLIAIGRQLASWMDGAGEGGDGRGWLTAWLKTPGPCDLEIVADVVPDGGARLWLDVPWEVLTAPGPEGDFLLANRLRPYSPVRRLGKRAAGGNPSNYALALAFVAASPRDVHPVLAYETEEMLILRATESLRLDLVVEESGTLEQLGERVALEGPFDAVHLSCHGLPDQDGQPARLLLEDEAGDRADADAADLVSAFGENRPKLVFLSACHSAEGEPAQSLALGLIQANLPAVLGWQAPVLDADGIGFAQALYHELARAQPLEAAIRSARQALFHADPNADWPGRDWHLLRGWLGPKGGGVLCRGKQTRRPHRNHGLKAFLDTTRRAVPVAGRYAFVGRRRQLQDCLRHVRQKQHAGILIHGFGRQGKSSLAARVANRLHDHVAAVVFGRYDGAAVLETIRDAFGSGPVAKAVEQALPRVRDNPSALRAVLHDLLTGPCREMGQSKGRRPLLLVIDDLEQALTDPGAEGGRHAVEPRDARPTLQAVIAAFDQAGPETRSALLLTSRYVFVLTDAEQGRDLAGRLLTIHLPPFDAVDSQKQARQAMRLRPEGAGEPPTPVSAARIERCRIAAAGNPGLQDLLIGRVREDPTQADAAIEAAEAYLKTGVNPATGEVRTFLETLVLGKLYGSLGEADRLALRSLTAFTLPVPSAVAAMGAEALAPGQGSAALHRMLGFGLCDRFEDVFSPATEAVKLNPLVAPTIPTLEAGEKAAVATATTEPLFLAWGGADGERPGPLNAQLAHLSLSARSADILYRTAEPALFWLVYNATMYREATELGPSALAVLDEAEIAPSVAMLRTVGDAVFASGDLEGARRWFQRGFEAVKTSLTNEPTAAALRHSYADVLRRTGEAAQAQALLEENAEVYERLDDVRSKAITMGQIADILQARGQLDEALSLKETEALPVYERLGDVENFGITHWEIARIKMQMLARGADPGVVAEIADHLTQAYEMICRVGRLEFIAAIGLDYAAVLAARGEVEEARAVLTRSRDGFRQLGREQRAQLAEAQLAALPLGAS